MIPFPRPDTGRPSGLPVIGPPPRLLDRLRTALRARHYSPRTEQTYAGWIRRFIVFHGKRHPDGLAEHEIAAFLSSLVIERQASASTQNQALAALLFFYQAVLGRELPWLGELVHGKRSPQMPVPVTRNIARAAILAVIRVVPAAKSPLPMMDHFEGTLVLEQLAAIGKVEDFFDAIDADDFAQATMLMKSAKVDASTIAIVIRKMKESDGEH